MYETLPALPYCKLCCPNVSISVATILVVNKKQTQLLKIGINYESRIEFHLIIQLIVLALNS